MDDALKREIAKSMAPAAVPLLRVAVTNYYDNKRFEKRQEYQVKMAERQSQALSEATSGGGTAAAQTATPAEPATDPDVGPAAEPAAEPAADPPEDGLDPLDEAVSHAEGLDSSIEQARQHEECGFCQDVLDQLRHEDPQTQRQGLRELKELREVTYGDYSPEEIERTMDGMDVVPLMVV